MGIHEKKVHALPAASLLVVMHAARQGAGGR
jgi:hypothetical protein